MPLVRTQIAFSDKLNRGKYQALQEQARRLGVIRTEVWQRYGSIKGVGLQDRTIRDKWIKEGRKFNVNATPWKQTLSDAIGDIKTHREAEKVKFRQAIAQHTTDESERKRLYGLLKFDKWIEDKYLTRVMRKICHRGHNHTYNQIIVRSDDYKVFILRKNALIKIQSLVKGKRIVVPSSTNLVPKGNLRIILCNNQVEVHYSVEIQEMHDCGTQTLVVDKGFTEVLTDSDGEHYGNNLGEVLIKESDRLKLKYQRRFKLKAMAKKKP